MTKDLYFEVELQISLLLDYLKSAIDETDKSQIGNLHEMILTALDVSINKLYPLENDDFIQSQEVTLVLKDENSGRVYSRKVPLDYRENSNGIVLTGEDEKAKESQIVFFSETAIKKMADITGKGGKTHPCKE